MVDSGVFDGILTELEKEEKIRRIKAMMADEDSLSKKIVDSALPWFGLGSLISALLAFGQSGSITAQAIFGSPVTYIFLFIGIAIGFTRGGRHAI